MALEEGLSIGPLATQGIFNEFQAENANMMPASTVGMPSLFPQPVFAPGPQQISHWELALFDQLQHGTSTAFNPMAASNFVHHANPQVNASLPPGKCFCLFIESICSSRL